VLEEAGHEVMEAPNGRIGLERYRHRPPDLVITDMVMPQMNGFDMIRGLMHEFPLAKVGALSGGQGNEKVLDEANLLGVRRTLQKPFGLQQLLDTVRYEVDC
jgi:YesN/AraC family two-component response regulator